MKSFDLLVVGDANPDVVLGPLRGPLEFGQREQLVEHAGLVLGGSAAIMACGAARLGLRVAFAGRVGDDPAGAFVREALAGRGVDVGLLVTDPVRPTPLTAVVMAGDGDRAILTAPGCLTETGPEDVPRDLIATSRHVHAASFFLMPRLARSLASVFGLARETGATTSLDTNDDPAGRWDHQLLDPVLEFTDFLLPNAAEASALSGKPIRSPLPPSWPAGGRRSWSRTARTAPSPTPGRGWHTHRPRPSTPWTPSARATASTPGSSPRPCTASTCAPRSPWPRPAVRCRPEHTVAPRHSPPGTRPSPRPARTSDLRDLPALPDPSASRTGR